MLQAGRAADAARVYALARAPADEKIAERSAAAVARGGVPGEKDGGSPISGDARPEVTVEVVDADGRPVANAPVVIAPGGMHWERLLRTQSNAAGNVRTDAAGTLRAPAQVGTSTVVVFAPNDGPGAFASSMPVDVTGARVRVALAATESIEGTILDVSSRPVAGVEVRAIPDVTELGSDSRALAGATSGADGTFAIRGVDSGGYRLFARGRGYVGPFENPTLGHLVTGGQRAVTLRASRERVLRGRVLVVDPGKPPRPATSRSDGVER